MAPPKRPWLRLYTETVWDRKLRRQPVASRWTWVTILAMARQSPVPGTLLLADEGQEPIVADDDDIADAAAVKPADARRARQEFERLGMLTRDNAGALVVAKWKQRQFESDEPRTAISHPVRQAVFARDSYQCVECGASENVTIDHIRPVTKGGSDDLENLQTLCGTCNSKKGNRIRQQRYRERQRNVTDNGRDNVSIGNGSRVTARAPATETESETENKTPPSPPAPSSEHETTDPPGQGGTAAPPTPTPADRVEQALEAIVAKAPAEHADTLRNGRRTKAIRQRLAELTSDGWTPAELAHRVDQLGWRVEHADGAVLHRLRALDGDPPNRVAAQQRAAETDAARQRQADQAAADQRRAELDAAIDNLPDADQAQLAKEAAAACPFPREPDLANTAVRGMARSILADRLAATGHRR